MFDVPWYIKFAIGSLAGFGIGRLIAYLEYDLHIPRIIVWLFVGVPLFVIVVWVLIRVLV